jgi:cytochrome c556
MKKILLISALTSVMLFSNNTESKEDQIKTMQNLEVAMSTIQKGFLYNNTGLVKQGITSLKDNVKNIKSFDIKNDKKRDFDAKKYSMAELKAIGLLADQMLIDFDKGDKEVILEGFQKTLNRCITCHLLIRKW